MEGKIKDLKKVEVCGESSEKGVYVCLKITVQKVLEGIHYWN